MQAERRGEEEVRRERREMSKSNFAKRAKKQRAKRAKKAKRKEQRKQREQEQSNEQKQLRKERRSQEQRAKRKELRERAKERRSKGAKEQRAKEQRAKKQRAEKESKAQESQEPRAKGARSKEKRVRAQLMRARRRTGRRAGGRKGNNEEKRKTSRNHTLLLAFQRSRGGGRGDHDERALGGGGGEVGEVCVVTFAFFRNIDGARRKHAELVGVAVVEGTFLLLLDDLAQGAHMFGHRINLEDPADGLARFVHNLDPQRSHLPFLCLFQDEVQETQNAAGGDSGCPETITVWRPRYRLITFPPLKTNRY